MFFMKRNKQKDLREIYKATERIQTAETPREADRLTGYAIGIIDEKLNTGKITVEMADAIAEMADVVGEEVRRELIEERHAREARRENKNIVMIEQFSQVTQG